MGRHFASGQGAYVNASPVSAFPLSMWCWAEHDSTATSGCAMSWSKYSGAGGASIYFRGDLSGDPITGRRIKESGIGDSNPQSAAYSVDTVYGIGLVLAASNDGRLYVNGTKTTTSASVDFPTATPDVVACSGLWEGPAAGLDATRVGYGSHFALWDAELTDAEMASLYAGFSPRRIRPQSLRFYWPALRENIDLCSGALSYIGAFPDPEDHRRTYGL